MSELSQKFEVHPVQVSAWKKEAQEHLCELFTDKRTREKEQEDQTKLTEQLYQQIGQLQVELNRMKKKLVKPHKLNPRLLIEPCNDIHSVSRQCTLPGLSKSTYYYTPVGESEENLYYMRLMDEQYLLTPYYGVGQMVYHLRNLGYEVNPKRVRRLLRLMGLRAICPAPQTSRPGKGEDHQVFPYLLNHIVINRPGQGVGETKLGGVSPIQVFRGGAKVPAIDRTAKL